MNNNLIEDSKEPYILIKEDSKSQYDLSPDPLSFSPSIPKKRVYDYSADDSISNVDSPAKTLPGEAFQYKKAMPFTVLKKNQGSYVWSGEIPDSSDEKADQETLATLTMIPASKKFVNGLPTVVTRKYPTKFYCVKCEYQGMTVIKEKMGKAAIILSTLFFFTLFWPCLAAVCCTRYCKDLIHECPNCGHIVGKRKFM